MNSLAKLDVYNLAMREAHYDFNLAIREAHRLYGHDADDKDRARAVATVRAARKAREEAAVKALY